MAARKKEPTAQPSFAFQSLIAPKPLPPPEAMHGFADQFPGEDFPSDTPVVSERTLCIVPPVDRGPEEDVVVEPDGDRFAVSLVRHYGSTVATVLYTRGQLEMLLRRIPAALGIG